MTAASIEGIPPNGGEAEEKLGDDGEGSEKVVSLRSEKGEALARLHQGETVSVEGAMVRKAGDQVREGDWFVVRSKLNGEPKLYQCEQWNPGLGEVYGKGNVGPFLDDKHEYIRVEKVDLQEEE